MKFAALEDIDSLPNEFSLFDTVEEAVQDNLYPYLVEVEEKEQIQNLKDFQFVPYDIGNRVVIKLSIGENKSKRITTDAFKQILGTPLAQHVMEEAPEGERHIPENRKVNFYAVDIIHPGKTGYDVEMRWGKPDPRHADVLPDLQKGSQMLYSGVKRNLTEKKDTNGESLVGQLVPAHIRNRIAKTLDLSNAAAMLHKAGTTKAYILDSSHDYPHEAYALKRHSGGKQLTPEELDEMALHHASLVPKRQFDENGNYELAPTEKDLKDHAIQRALINAFNARKNKKQLYEYFEKTPRDTQRVLDFLQKLRPNGKFVEQDINNLVALTDKEFTPAKIQPHVKKYGINTNSSTFKTALGNFKKQHGSFKISKIMDDAKNWYLEHTGKHVDIKPEEISEASKEIVPIFEKGGRKENLQRQPMLKRIFNKPKHVIEFRALHFPKDDKFTTILHKPVPVDMYTDESIINSIMNRVKDTYDFHKNRVDTHLKEFQEAEQGLKKAFQTENNPVILRQHTEIYAKAFEKLKEAQKERDAMLVSYLYAKTGMRPGYNEKTNSHINNDLEKINARRVTGLSRLLEKEPVRGSATLELGDINLSKPDHVSFSYPSKTKKAEEKKSQGHLPDFISTDYIHDPFLHKVFADKKKEIEDRVKFENDLGSNLVDEKILDKVFANNPELALRWKKELLNRHVGHPSEHIRVFDHDPEDFLKSFGLNSHTTPVNTPEPLERSFIPLMKAVFGEGYNTTRVNEKNKKVPPVTLTPYDFRRHVITNMASMMAYKVGREMAHKKQPLATLLTKAMKNVQSRLTPYTGHSTEGSLDNYVDPHAIISTILEAIKDYKAGINKLDYIKENLHGHS